MARDNDALATPFVNRRLSSQTLDLPSICSLLNRDARESSRLCWAEGYRNLHSALESGSEILCVVKCRKLIHSRATAFAINHLERTGTPVIEVSETEFSTLSTHQEPQGVGAVVRQRWHRLIEESPKNDDVWVVLDNVRTPGNLGTILRTCAAVNAKGIMLIGGEADPYDPACIRASMGAIFHQRLIRTSAKALLGWRRRHYCHIIGTSPSARLHYRNANLRGPLLLVMGNERTGVRERQSNLCDAMVRIPVSDHVDSLNLAIATGVLLYESFEQRQRSMSTRQKQRTTGFEAN